MKRKALRVALYVGCVALTAWLVRYEAFPTWFADTIDGYRDLVDEGALLVDNWMTVTYEGAPVGYSHTSMAAPESGQDDLFRMQNRTRLNLRVLGTTQRISAVATAALDAGFRLQEFDFRLTSSKYSAHIHGRREHGEIFTVVIDTGAGAQTLELEIPDDVIIYSPMTEMAMSRLRLGQHLRIRTLDPVTLELADVLCTALRRETITHAGEEVETTVFTMEYQGMESHAWMRSDGRIIRQETPLGWVLEASDQQQATASLQQAGESPDMILTQAVPLKGVITDPETCRELTLTLFNLHIDLERQNSNRQHATAEGDRQYRILLEARPLPAGGRPLGDYDADEMAPYLESTPFVQVEHPAIRDRAADIVGDAADSLEAARRIYDWVHRKIEKNPTISLPSALDVLKQRVGDCNEHTYLYVALARAAGIPARIKVGMVYTPSGFYFHAWPAVYTGEWVEMDPTLGQETVGATHIALLEGELGNQIELMKVLGKLHAEVVDQAY